MFRQSSPKLLIFACCALSLAPLRGFSQDPSTAAIPDLAGVIDDTRHTLVVEALLASDGSVIDFSAAVSLVPPRTNIGNPPLILVETYDARGNLLTTMNGWDPRWEFQETEDGEQMEVQPEGLGSFVIPFDHAIATVVLTDLQIDQQLLEMDVSATVTGFCHDNPDDPECEGFVANGAPTADAGGPYAVDEGDSIALSGAGSSDPDDDILAYFWDLDEDGTLGETGTAAANGDETGETPTFSAAALTAPAVIDIVLEVCDSEPLCDQDVTTVEVLPLDGDFDGVADPEDNCPDIANPGQENNDGDAEGDACDADDDNDGVQDSEDNCPFDANPDQADLDGDGIGSVCDPVEDVNQPPLADDDSYSTDEDVVLMVGAPGVLEGDADENPATLLVSGHTQPTHGTVNVNSDGTFTYTPAQHYFGDDAFEYTVTDEHGETGTAMVSLTVNPVNDPPELAVDRATAAIQYSDTIGTVVFTATDVDDALLNPTVQWSDDDGATWSGGAPANLALMPGATACVNQSFDDSPVLGSTCQWTLEGQFALAAGTYDVRLTASDAADSTASAQTLLIVSAEQAQVEISSDNPVAVGVTGNGGNSVPFNLEFTVRERLPDSAEFTAQAGDVTRTLPDLKLEPVGPGGTVSPIAPCDVVSNGESAYDEVLTFTCSFDEVPVNTYSVEAGLSGGYYAGSDDDVLTVSDPSLGDTSGGGWFYWPGTEDRTSFGYTMKYNKKRTNVQGNFLLIRHITDAPEGEDKWRVKSNAIEGLALGQESGFGWGSFTTKATHEAPDVDTEGNYETTVYVEDHGEPGAGVDRLWLQTRDRDRDVISDLSLGTPADSNAATLEGGNIAVPEATSRGGRTR